MPDAIESRAADVLDRLAAQQHGSGVVESWDAISQQVGILYDSGGLPRGSLTGWTAMDELYTVAPQQWTLVTGIPGMGKSEWLDALAVNLAESGEWVFAMHSPENFPVAMHVIRLMEKRARKPFGEGRTPRMTRDEMKFAGKWIRDRFTWIASDMNTLMDLVRTGLRLGSRPNKKLGIVIDPWNMLNHYDPLVRLPGMTETEYISDVLSRLTRLLRSDEGAHCHVFVVAHPAKLYRGADGKYPTPTGYDVAGSAHFFNKADNIIGIHRDKSFGNQDVEIHTQKVRFRNIGRFGNCVLKFDRVTGTYFEHGGAAIVDLATGRSELYADPRRGVDDLERDTERAAIVAEGA